MSTTTCFPDLARFSLTAIALGGDGLVAGVVLAFITQFATVGAGVELTPFALAIASLILLQGIAFDGVALVYARYRGLDRSYSGVSVLSLRDPVAVILGCMTALIATFVDAFLVPTFGARAGLNQVVEIAAQDPEVLLLLVPALLLLIGLGEELLFHGVVQDHIHESFGPAPGIVLASAIFVTIRYVMLTGGAGGCLATIGILFPPSAVLGTAYELTDNITVPALIHGAYNATLFSLVYPVLRFTEMNPGRVPTGLLF